MGKELSPSEVLDGVVARLRESLVGEVRFYPYQPDATLAFLHDSSRMKLTMVVSMMVGREPQMWQRVYFVPQVGITEAYLEPLLFDGMSALKVFLRSMEVMVSQPEPVIIGGEE